MLATHAPGRSTSGIGGSITSALSRWSIAFCAASLPASFGRMYSKYSRTPSRVRGTSAGSQVCSSAPIAHSAQYCSSSACESRPGP